MKVKVGHYTYTEDVVEIDDKWKKYAKISIKDLMKMTDEEVDYHDDNLDSFLSAVNKAYYPISNDGDDYIRVSDLEDNVIWEE